MRSGRRRAVEVVLVLALAAGLLVPGAGPAGAQYPIDAPDDCVELFDLGGEETTGFVFGEVIRIIVRAVCGASGDVLGFLEPGGTFLFSASADGGTVDSGAVALPSRLRPGRYRLVVRTGDGTYVRPVRISVGVAPDAFDRLRGAVGALQLQGATRAGSRSSESGSSMFGLEAEPARLGTLQTRLASFSHSEADGPTAQRISGRRHSPVAGLTGAPGLFASFSPFSP